MGLRPLAFWHCGFESRWEHVLLSLVIVVCYRVEVFASGWSLVRRIPSDCGLSECDREASIMRPWTTRGLLRCGKENYTYILGCLWLTADIHRQNWLQFHLDVYSSYIAAQMALLCFNVRRLEDIAVTKYTVFNVQGVKKEAGAARKGWSKGNKKMRAKYKEERISHRI